MKIWLRSRSGGTDLRRSGTRLSFTQIQRFGVAVGIVVLIATPPLEGHAQLAGCAKVLWEFVGKPLTGVMIEKGGGLLFDYYADKLKRQREVVVTRDDIQLLTREYDRRGSSECELRQEFEAIYGRDARRVQPRSFSAEAHCSITGATGYADGLPSQQQALLGAINSGINYGGVPECCRRGAQLVE
jgi:hypothetical protein